MTHDSVAVIIPCYNGSAFIAEAIESALAQTHSKLEIVVVNDGSTDGSSAVLRRYASRVRIVEQENQGVAAARNRGIETSTSPFIAFLDQDDRWRPEKTVRQLASLRRHPEAALVFCDRLWIDDRGGRIDPPPHRRPSTPWLRALIRGNFILPSTVLLRRDALGAERFVPGTAGSDDWDLWLRLAARWELVHLAEPLVEYRVHACNASRDTEAMMRGFLTVLSRAIDRGLPPDVLREADAHRRGVLEALGHYAFERHDWIEARRFFRQGRVRWRSPAGFRLLLASLPPPLRSLAQQVRRLRGTRRFRSARHESVIRSTA
ncbi:MAG TPA: glycosyltransferase [Vicinamibacterales bacterium]|nr:glycosyltransferase [Vicinamibacterales bacterium]